MFSELDRINHKPLVFEFYTASDLWTDEYTSKQMLSYHLNEDLDVSSRNSRFIDKSVEWIQRKFNINENSKVADFGCGPGLYSQRLANRGAQITGIDFSPRSISYARETAVKERLSIEYVNQNYLEFETDEQFDLIIMIMCDFCALSPEQRQQLLAKFNRFLKPDGAVLLDVYSLNAYQQREEIAVYEKNQLNSFWSPNDYYGFLNTFKYDDDNVVLDKYTIVEEDRTRMVYNWLQYFDPDQLKQEFAKQKLVINEIFANVAGSEYDPAGNEFAIIARKS